MAFDTSGIRLKPCVDLFSTEASRQDASLEKIREIPLDQLVPAFPVRFPFGSCYP